MKAVENIYIKFICTNKYLNLGCKSVGHSYVWVLCKNDQNKVLSMGTWNNIKNGFK